MGGRGDGKCVETSQLPVLNFRHGGWMGMSDSVIDGGQPKGDGAWWIEKKRVDA